VGTSRWVTAAMLILTLLWASAPATSRPATTFTASDVSARAAELVAQGHAAMRAGDAQAALDSFLDAKSLWNKQGIKTDINDPVMYADLCGIGAAYMALGHNDKANDPLDRAYVSKLREHSLIVNRAILDYVQHVKVQRGTKEMLDLLSPDDAPTDEPTINVLGACVQYSMLDPNLTRGQLYQKALDLYEKLNKALESQRPGQRRWGPAWVTPNTFDAKSAKLSAGKEAYEQSIRDRDAADAVLADANVEMKKALHRAGVKRDLIQQRMVDRAQAKVDKASSAYELARLNVPAMRKAIPWPEWPATFPPLLPDSAGGGAFGSPAAVPTVAVARPAPKPTAVAIAPTPKPAPAAIEPPPVAAAPPVARSVSRHAVAIPVGPDVLITAAASLEGATSLMIENSQGASIKAEVARKDVTSGLAILRIQGHELQYLNLASSFAGGDVTCWGFPDVSIFNPVPDQIPGNAISPKAAKWTISLRRHPRLPGAALLDKSGALVGVELGERDSVMTQLPAVRLEEIRQFLGADAPKSECANPDPAGMWQMTASRDIN
jgi:tetratricopeptide (TPR) repeat protein